MDHLDGKPCGQKVGQATSTATFADRRLDRLPRQQAFKTEGWVSCFDRKLGKPSNSTVCHYAFCICFLDGRLRYVWLKTSLQRDRNGTRQIYDLFFVCVSPRGSLQKQEARKGTFQLYDWFLCVWLRASCKKQEIRKGTFQLYDWLLLVLLNTFIKKQTNRRVGCL